jgi:hypothetical protein
MRGRWMILSMLAMALPAVAADPVPEISRPAATPQPVGVLHTLRQIPEACARIQGRFTGDPADPYKFELVKTSPNCAPRARLVDAAKAKPSEAGGWKFNDLVRVPSTRCATQFAVVRVWRKPSDAAVPPKPDAQGSSRLYLEDMKAAAKAGNLNPTPVYAVSTAVEGTPCTP